MVLPVLAALTGCVASGVKKAGFVEAPYCTISVDGVRYRFHSDPRAAAKLTQAAARWRARQVFLTSPTSVEFDCLRSVKGALERAGKTVDFKAAG